MLKTGLVIFWKISKLLTNVVNEYRVYHGNRDKDKIKSLPISSKLKKLIRVDYFFFNTKNILISYKIHLFKQ